MMSLLLGLGLLLGLARTLGEVAVRRGLPSVSGELIAGVLLGPTVFGFLAPDMAGFLFPQDGPVRIVFSGFSALAAIFFLFAAGLEVDFSRTLGRGKPAVVVALAGLGLSFVLGAGAAALFPEFFAILPGRAVAGHAFFLGTALAVTALAMITKTMLDLGLFRSDFGMLVIASAVLTDILAWTMFAICLSLNGHKAAEGTDIGVTAGLSVGFAVLMLWMVRPLLDRLLAWCGEHDVGQGSVIGFSLALALLCAAFTEWIGAHAVFGAFLAGVSLGDSEHLREQTRTVVMHFVNYIFVPLFVATIGLKLDLIHHFDPLLTGVLLVLAIGGKILGSGFAARLCGLSRAESLSIGFAMNDRGVMAIIVAEMALGQGLIAPRLHAALLTVALVTSLMSGPIIKRLLRTATSCGLARFMNSRSFAPLLAAGECRQAIQHLVGLASKSAGLDEQAVAAAVLAREETMSTAIGAGIAVPHARLAGLSQPVIAVGLAPAGIDFDAPDGELTRLVFLILTPDHDEGAQLTIIADIARLAKQKDFVATMLGTHSFEDFVQSLRRYRQTACER